MCKETQEPLNIKRAERASELVNVECGLQNMPVEITDQARLFAARLVILGHTVHHARMVSVYYAQVLQYEQNKKVKK